MALIGVIPAALVLPVLGAGIALGQVSGSSARMAPEDPKEERSILRFLRKSLRVGGECRRTGEQDPPDH